MAAAKKGVVASVRQAIGDLLGDKPKRKSPKRVEAGKKAAVTRKTRTAVKTARTAVKKAVTTVSKTVAGKKAAAKRSR